MNYGELKTLIQDYCQNSETSFVAHIPDFVRSAEDKTFLTVQMPAFWKSDSTLRTTDGTAEFTAVAGTIDISSVRIGENENPVASVVTTLATHARNAGTGNVYITEGDLSKFPIDTTISIPMADGSIFTPRISSSTTVPGSRDILFFADGDVFPETGLTPDMAAGVTITHSMTQSGTVRYLLRKDYNFLLEAYPGTTSAVTKGIPKYYAVSSAGDNSLNPTLTIRLGPIPDGVYAVTVDYYGKTAADSITASDSTTTWLSVVFPDTLLYGSLVEAYIYMKGEPDLVQTYTTQFQNSLMMIKNLGEGRQTGDSFVLGAKRINPQ